MRLILGFLLLLIALPAYAEGRVALLIGNGVYELPRLALRNPVNDVRDLDGAFSELGFEVKRVENASKAEMRDALGWLDRKSVV